MEALAVQLLDSRDETLEYPVSISLYLENNILTHVLQRPFLVGEHDTLDHLKACETNLLTSGLYLLEYDVVELLAEAQILKVTALDAVSRL